MKIADVRARAFAMPLNDPSYPPRPYRFYAREYFVIEHLTDPDALRAVVPEPLEVSDPIVKFEFIRLPDTTGFGDFTECGQMIPVRFRGESGIFVHSMYLDDEAPIAGGREIWGFRRNWRGQNFAMRARCLSARCISARCSAPWAAWVISTRSWIQLPSCANSASRISSSRSFLMSMERHAFASLCAIAGGTVLSRARGADR